MTAYLQRVPNLRAQDWPKFTISLMRNDIISSLAFKTICYILLRTWAEWCLDSRATCHIGIKSTTFEAKKRKEQRKKGGERGSSQLLKTEEKEHALFLVPWEEHSWWGLWAGHIWYSPTGNIQWNATSVYLKDRQGMLALPLQGKLFRQGSPGDRLWLLHLRLKELTTVL